MDFQASLICITVKAMAGLNGLTLGKCRATVRICREREMCGKIRCDIFRAGESEFCVGRTQCSLWQFWSAVQWLWITQAKCHDGSLLFFKSVPFKPFSLHLLSAVFLPLYLASSFNFPSLSLSLPLWRPWETQGKRGIQYQVLIHTHHHTEEKNVGSWAAQFRLDSAIDRMLYQPLPWQLTRARTEPQRLFTPVSYSLPPRSAI